jgi:mannose-1-phosphate guanylyltransferase/mannose-6-phosphate isomerase
MVQECLDASNMLGELLLEPVARNTAAAMTLAAMQEQGNKHHAEKSLLLFCPADHHVPDVSTFKVSIEAGIQAATEGAIVTFGVSPSFPSTAFGYIEQGKSLSHGGRQVSRFIEKPTADKAKELVLGGGVLWNAGIFLVSSQTLLDAMALYAPDILRTCEAAMKHAISEKVGAHVFVRPEKEAFESCRSDSIDYAVMEKHTNVVVLPFHGQWSDVGSWSAVAELSEADSDGNKAVGAGVFLNTKNTFVYAPQRTVAALGVQDLLIVDTPDALLVAHASQVEKVKDLVGVLNAQNSTQTVTHRKVARPWGWYDRIDSGDRFQVKRIGVKPGASLSLQKHHHRAEHWIVVAGTAQVTRGEETFLLSENQSTYIPIGEVHRLTNPGKVLLEMIEVQSGTYLGEDDIVRLEDVYGRTNEMPHK